MKIQNKIPKFLIKYIFEYFLKSLQVNNYFKNKHEKQARIFGQREIKIVGDAVKFLILKKHFYVSATEPNDKNFI